jgi:phage terminase small subunit
MTTTKKPANKKPAKKKRRRRAAVVNARAAGASATTSSASAPLPSSTGAPALETLSAHHARFVAEYLIDLNATAAYRRAYGPVKDADVSGPRLLGIVGIAAAIAEGKARQMATADLSAARVLEELRRVAFANVREYFDGETGAAKHPHQLTAEQGAALAGFEVLIKNAKAGDGVTDTIHKFKLWDKVRALELLATHFELLIEHVKIDTTSVDARVARLVAARKRTAP